MPSRSPWQALTTLVLLYGDHPDLLERCLTPLAELARQGQIRLAIAGNELSERSQTLLGEILREVPLGGGQHRILLRPDNLGKYPRMRELLEATAEWESPHVMWFDDDSWIQDSNPSAWLERVQAALVEAQGPLQAPVMLGAIWGQGLQGQQHAWVNSRPWCKKPVRAGHMVRFAQGAWWVIDRRILMTHDWPDRDLHHNGGDVMLGELLRQQGYLLVRYQDQIAINADAQGRASKSRRRGLDQEPVGTSFRRAL